MDFIKPHLIKWYSKVALRVAEKNIKLSFRDLEKSSIKLTETKSHRAFNECCIINNLLPKYTNRYRYKRYFKKIIEKE